MRKSRMRKKMSRMLRKRSLKKKQTMSMKPITKLQVLGHLVLIFLARLPAIT